MKPVWDFWADVRPSGAQGGPPGTDPVRKTMQIAQQITPGDQIAHSCTICKVLLRGGRPTKHKNVKDKYQVPYSVLLRLGLRQLILLRAARCRPHTAKPTCFAVGLLVRCRTLKHPRPVRRGSTMVVIKCRIGVVLHLGGAFNMAMQSVLPRGVSSA